MHHALPFTDNSITIEITIDMSKSDKPASKSDIILAMSHTATEDYMQQLVDRVKTYEFRKKLYPPTVLRVWFYETAPISAITYICEIDPANVRGQDPPLPETGLGNKEYNSGDPTFKGYDFAYRVKSCWRLREAVKLEALKGYGIGGAPRGMVYVPEQLGRDIVWDKQEECEVLSVGRLMTPPPNTMH